MFKNIVCYISNNKRREMFHMEVAKSKDLVIRFYNAADRTSFVEELTKQAEQNQQSISINELADHEILEFAMTASKRKTAIEHFIKCAFRQTVSSGDDQIPSMTEILNCDHGDMALSKAELAILFGQRTDSPLMRRIFETIDTGPV